MNKAQQSLPELSNHASILIMLTDGEPTEGKCHQGYPGRCWVCSLWKALGMPSGGREAKGKAEHLSKSRVQTIKSKVLLCPEVGNWESFCMTGVAQGPKGGAGLLG